MSQKMFKAIEAGYKALARDDLKTSESIFRNVRDTMSELHGNLGLAHVYGHLHLFGRSEQLLLAMLPELKGKDLVLVRMLLGRIYLDWGRPQDAFDCLQQAYHEDATSPLILLTLAEVRLGHLDEAEKLARKAVDADLENAEEMLGDVFVCQRNWQAAVVQFQKLYGKQPQIAGKLGVSLANLDRDEEAIPYLREGIRNGDLGCVRYVVSAFVAIGKYRNALAYAQMGVEQGIRGLQGLMGICHLRLGEFKQAEECLLRSKKEREHLQRVNYHLGMCYAEMGEFEQALKALKCAIRAKELGAWYASGQVNKKLNQLAQARRCFRKSTELEGEFAGAASWELGNLYAGEHNVQEAEKYFQDAWLAGYANGGIAMGHLLLQENPQEALRWFKQVADLGNEEVLPAMAECLIALGETEQAREILLQAMERGNEHARLELAVLYDQEGNAEEADRMFEEAMEHRLSNAYRRYGEILLKRKDTLGAIAYLTQAWEEDHDRYALVPLAYAYAKTDSKESEVQSLRYLYLAEKMGCLMGKYSRQLKERLRNLMGEQEEA